MGVIGVGVEPLVVVRELGEVLDYLLVEDCNSFEVLVEMAVMAVMVEMVEPFSH